MHYTDAFVLIHMRILQTIAIFLNPLILIWLHRYNAANETAEEWRKHMFYQSIQTEKFNLIFFTDHSNLYFGSNFFHLKTVVTSEKCNWIVCLYPKKMQGLLWNTQPCYRDGNILWLSRFAGYLILQKAASLKKSLLKTWTTMTSASFFCNKFIFINILTESTWSICIKSILNHRLSGLSNLSN